MNFVRLAAVLLGASVAGLAPIAAARGDDLAREYDQVRKIALKDPKVRAAFERANEKLEKRIIEIDPTLKPFIEKQHGARKKAERASKSAAARTTHIVAKGETLSSISRRYKVTVSSLMQVNHISKEATLRVGQKLVIPTAGG
jgi:nucleoid-associated protein YgaU